MLMLPPSANISRAKQRTFSILPRKHWDASWASWLTMSSLKTLGGSGKARPWPIIPAMLLCYEMSIVQRRRSILNGSVRQMRLCFPWPTNRFRGVSCLYRQITPHDQESSCLLADPDTDRLGALAFGFGAALI